MNAFVGSWPNEVHSDSGNHGASPRSKIEMFENRLVCPATDEGMSPFGTENWLGYTASYNISAQGTFGTHRRGSERIAEDAVASNIQPELRERMEANQRLRDTVRDTLITVNTEFSEEYPNSDIQARISVDPEEPNREDYEIRVSVDVSEVEEWMEIREELKAIARRNERSGIDLYTVVDRKR